MAPFFFCDRAFALIIRPSQTAPQHPGASGTAK